MILPVVFYVFVVCTAIQIVYYLSFSTILSKSKKVAKSQEKPPVSVLIYVKNSARYLEENISYFINQNYPKFEILLIDNASSDNTIEILEKLKNQHKEIRIIDVENNESFWGNKKYTYTLAIKAAKYERLVFSEIKAKPTSKDWIAGVTEKFSSKKTIVLGYSKFLKESSPSNLVIRFANLLHFLQSFTSTKYGSPFSASAYNYGIKKNEFFRAKGFINHIKIREGKDDLFIKDASKGGNVTYSISDKTFVEMDAISFKDWFQERRNALFLGKHYHLRNQLFLFLFPITKLLFYTLSIALFFFITWKKIVPFVISYFLIQILVLGFATKTFKERSLIFYIPILDFLLLFIQISIFFANLVSKPKYWR